MSDLPFPSDGRPSVRLILIRHGESEQNAAAAGMGAGPAGGPECWRLTSRGEAQAEAAGRWLRAILTGRTRVYTSPFARARRTAELLALGRPVTAPELADRDWGRFFAASSPADQEARREEARRQSAADPWDWRPVDGESVRDLCQRVARLLDSLATAAEPTVLVSHGEVIRAARMIIEGTPLRLPLAPRRDNRRIERIPNTGLIMYSRFLGECVPRYERRCFIAEPAAVPADWESLSWTGLRPLAPVSPPPGPG